MKDFNYLDQYLLQHHRKEYALIIMDRSPFGVIHRDQEKVMKEYSETYGIVYKIHSDDFYYFDCFNNNSDREQVISDRWELLFEVTSFSSPLLELIDIFGTISPIDFNNLRD